MFQRFKGKTIIITNASGIIGSTCARLFHKEGANIVINDLNDQKLIELKKELMENILIQNKDLTISKEAFDVVKSTLDTFGTFHTLICNEDSSNCKYTMEVDLDTWKESVDKNLISLFHILQAVYRTFREQRYGSIIFVSSLMGRCGGNGAINYASSMGGVLGIMKGISKEWSHWGVTCSAVCPGVIMEGEQGFPKELKNQFQPTQVELASKRNVTAEEVAKIILFLSSEDGRPINGQAINADYGLHIYFQ